MPLESLDAFQQLCNGLGMKATSLEEGKKTMPSSELAASLKSSYESKLDSLVKADGILVLGEDITQDHWVISFFVKRLIPDGCKVVTLDEKENGLDNFAAFSLKSKNASHVEVVNALTATLKTDQPDFSKVSKSSGISMDQLKSVNQVLKSARNLVIVIGYAEDEEANNKELLKAAQALAKQTGASILDVKGGANSLAASQLQLDTSIDLNGVEVCLLAIGDERPSQQLIKRFEKVPFLIIQSSYVSPLTANAQVVLPVQNWLEQEGTYLNFSGTLQKASPSLKSIEGVVSNQEVFIRLAEKTRIKMDANWKTHLTKRVSPVTID